MTKEEMRLKIIELVRPTVTNPDVKLWISRATELEKWITESASGTAESAAGQAETPLQKRTSQKPSTKSGHLQSSPA